MKGKHNIWMPIADMLASVVLIVLILFIIEAILPGITMQSKGREVLQQIEGALKPFEEKGYVTVYPEQGLIEFTDLTFETGSAILAPEMNEIITAIAMQLKKPMESNAELNIMIEGHTDPAKVKAVINKGGYFENNMQLSSLRALSVRDNLLKNFPASYAGRVAIAGYGDTRLKDKNNPLSRSNRRVDMRIIWDKQTVGY